MCLWFGFTSNIVWDSKLWERGNCYNMRSLWLICISLFCLWLGLGLRIISEGRSAQGLHQICSTDGQDFGERLNGTFTMIIAGSALLWVQTRRQLSSDALNHQCLFRLQLTLLTGLSCPENKRHLKSIWNYFWWLFFTFMVLFSESGRVRHRGGSQWTMGHLWDLAFLPPCGETVQQSSNLKMMLESTVSKC